MADEQNTFNPNAPDEDDSAQEELTLEEAQEELRQIKEDPDLTPAERSQKSNEAYERISRQLRPDALDSFQRYQKEATEEALEDLPDDARPGIHEYSPSGTIAGSEGDNANYDPEKARMENQDEDDEWDPEGGEDDDLPENYEPAERPE